MGGYCGSLGMLVFVAGRKAACTCLCSIRMPSPKPQVHKWFLSFSVDFGLKVSVKCIHSPICVSVLVDCSWSCSVLCLLSNREDCLSMCVCVCKRVCEYPHCVNFWEQETSSVCQLTAKVPQPVPTCLYVPLARLRASSQLAQ